MKFKRSGPSPFKCTTNLDEVEVWVEEIEKVFLVMKCIEEKKLKHGQGFGEPLVQRKASHSLGAGV